MNRPAKGYIPYSGQQTGPFFALRVAGGEASFTRAIEGPLPLSAYEASHGSTAINHGLPRFRDVSFAAAYPLGQVLLSDPGFAGGRPSRGLQSPHPRRRRGERHAGGRAPLRPRQQDGPAASGRGLRNAAELHRGRRLRHDPGLEERSHHARARRRTGTSSARPTACAGSSCLRTASTRSTKPGARSPWPRRPERAARAGPSWLSAGWGTSLLDFWDDFAADGVLDPRPATRGGHALRLAHRRGRCPGERQRRGDLLSGLALPEPRHLVAQGNARRPHRQLLHDALARRLGRGGGFRRAGRRTRSRDGRVRPRSSPQALSRPRSRKPPSSTSARSGPRPASGRRTAASSASRARATPPAAAGAPAPTSGTTSRRPPSSSALWPGPCARRSSSKRPTTRA